MGSSSPIWRLPVRRSPAEWAFRYLYNRPEVVTILSGMSTMEQIEDNLRIFEHADANCVSAEEAAQECGRCLRCDVYGIGALTGRGLEAW